MKKEEMKVLEVVKETKILGKNIQMYGDIRNPLFVAKDVAEWIEHSNSRSMLKSIDEDEKEVNNVYTLGGNQEQWFLTEDGLYEVCMSSRKPIAKQMKKGIKLYLKQIRLTGGYIPVVEEDDDVTILAKGMKILQRTVEEKDAIIKSQQPKVDSYNRLVNASGTMDMNTVAKEVGIGEYKLFEYLRNKKVLFLNPDGNNIPYERFRKEGKFEVFEKLCRDGSYRSVTRATRKGLTYIEKLLRKDKIVGGVL